MTSDGPLPSAQTSRSLPCAGRSGLSGGCARWKTKYGSSHPLRVDYIEVYRDHLAMGENYGPPQSDIASSLTIEEFLNGSSWQENIRKLHGEAVFQEVIAFIKG